MRSRVTPARGVARRARACAVRAVCKNGSAYSMPASACVRKCMPRAPAGIAQPVTPPAAVKYASGIVAQAAKVAKGVYARSSRSGTVVLRRRHAA